MKKLDIHQIILFVLVVWVICFFCYPATVLADANDKKAADGADLDVEIKKRLYSTEKTLDFSVQAGAIMNHPYIRMPLAHTSLSYFFTSRVGIGVDFSYMLNDLSLTEKIYGAIFRQKFSKDKPSRICLENFFYTANHFISLAPCESSIDTPEAKKKRIDDMLAPYQTLDPAPRIGPSYPAIRDIDMIIIGKITVVPVYGKLLLFMKKVIHFNSFLNFGAGVALSDYYPAKLYTSTNHPYRGPTPLEGSNRPVPGVTSDQVKEYGVAGRAAPKQENVFTISLGIGQKFHFSQNLALHIEGRNYTLINSSGAQGLEYYYALWGGLALRL